MTKRAYPTPDTVGSLSPVVINLPNDVESLANFRFALLSLANENNWEKVGDIDPSAMADVWTEVLFLLPNEIEE